MNNNNQDDKPIHILNTSSNLLGLCFIVLTSLKLLNLTAKTLVDEFTAIAILMFMTSSVLSFLSLKSKGKKSVRLEEIADIVFFIGLFTLFVITVFITFNFL